MEELEFIDRLGAARRAHVHIRTIDAWLRDKKLETYYDDNWFHVRISTEELDRFIEARREAAIARRRK